MQAKLLRVLQERELRRVGDDRMRKVDVRVIAAANRDLAELVAAGRFRADLFYRLHVIRLHVPPLRERAGDLPELVAHILARQADGGPVRAVGRAAMARLLAYSWPGNVRELENELARAAAVAGATIEVSDLSPHIANVVPSRTARGRERERELLLRPQVEALERSLIEDAMRRTRGNQSAAAKLLGLSRFGLQKKLRRHGITASGT
jgi:DNA-binding NtrC family response regulator